ncbi:serine-rich adhesin for platelets-like [Hoplias malabaricus]|uniref:serine-rich adhesin for platelets-like n=1 Tax=Hoplias malabaricus TaxID=27720 RepID=UPI0034634E37
MGRLDDAAKRKVVELREAGLSFRKIKAVLELENIKVSAQAIYLFLKEFHGRTRPKDSMAGNSGHASASGLALAREVGLSEVRQSTWNEQQLRCLLRDASRITGYPSSSDATGQGGTSQDLRGQPSGTGTANHEQQEADGKDEDVRIVSVTSLAQNSINTVRSGVSSGTMTSAFSRKRYTPSPANPVLVARKRLLDKALFHRARIRDSSPQAAQQTVPLLRRDQACFTGSEGRKVLLPQTASFDLTTARPPHVRGIHPGANAFRRGILQRANMSTRSPQQQLRMSIQLPTPSQSSVAPQNASSSIRAQILPSQHSPPCQQSSPEASAQSSLPEQVKSLASEVRSLGLALRMIMEQQGRLEREQSQQTQVQKQILSTLQELASKLGPCGLQHSTNASVSSCPFSSASFSQSTFTTSQGSYSSCSQAQSRYSEIDASGLENIEAFSLDGLSSATINGFQPCSTSDTLSFPQTHTFTQSQTQTYTPDVLTYTQSHTDTFTGMDNKSVELASNSTEGSFQTSGSSTQSSSQPISAHDAQLTIIKVENV